MKHIYDIAIIDGKGGGIGKILVESIKKEIPNLTVLALGTNSVATTQMIKAGADDGATGENAIIHNAYRVPIIVGVLAIIMPNSLLGELTPKMAEAISDSDAMKILIPSHKCNAYIAGVSDLSLQQLINDSIELIKEKINKSAI
ncbi:DUF3842 family protein [Sedimentibacter sp. zth1]|uniref:DUF3842 family protein n=1 Tax=Sedimentibacter sp. zth1 TaxID=2816908 RepID=UPI001A92F5F3|nr:DUF3842 family protein [Sedimentibacter sp. zth1]QSX06178.1 DUF3842 family protein [Sedimentibacter sp. zth1]